LCVGMVMRTAGILKISFRHRFIPENMQRRKCKQASMLKQKVTKRKREQVMLLVNKKTEAYVLQPGKSATCSHNVVTTHERHKR